jgi:hypothetical protein
MHLFETPEKKMQAAFSGPEMKSIWPILKKVAPLLKKIEAGTNFPMAIPELDPLLSGAGLKTSERIALKAAMSRAGLLK